MSNKGFIKVFSVLLALISLYYLSFTVVGWQYNKKANEYANGNLALKNQYLDSLSSEKSIWDTRSNKFGKKRSD